MGKCGYESKLEWNYLAPEMKLLVKAKAELIMKGLKLNEVDIGHGSGFF